MTKTLRIIGGGLAGCEAAWQAAHAGLRVVLYEMRPVYGTVAHQTGTLAELVCSNSFRSDDLYSSAVGLLHDELRRSGSLILAAADHNKVPAGSALAVDRNTFADEIETKIEEHPNISVKREEVRQLPQSHEGLAIIATGPLTSDALSAEILRLTDTQSLAFFDAIAPVIHADSIDFDKAWRQSRYDKKGPADDGTAYINCPLNREMYELFVDDLISADKVDLRAWEDDTPFFEGCLPIEVMAERGRETLRFGPLKPVGLTNPHSSDRPHAVVQLRQDNKLGTLFNMVGFQTRMKHGAQVDVFRKIPGLENARFARLGGIHRNTFINSPQLLDSTLRLRSAPHLRFAGQITGVEGYVESAATGLLASRFAVSDLLGQEIIPPPATTAFGALLNHITVGADSGSFQPMNCNFGLFPPIVARVGRKERRRLMVERARRDLDGWHASVASYNIAERGHDGAVLGPCVPGTAQTRDRQ